METHTELPLREKKPPRRAAGVALFLATSALVTWDLIVLARTPPFAERLPQFAPIQAQGGGATLPDGRQVRVTEVARPVEKQRVGAPVSAWRWDGRLLPLRGADWDAYGLQQPADTHRITFRVSRLGRRWPTAFSVQPLPPATVAARLPSWGGPTDADYVDARVYVAASPKATSGRVRLGVGTGPVTLAEQPLPYRPARARGPEFDVRAVPPDEAGWRWPGGRPASFLRLEMPPELGHRHYDRAEANRSVVAVDWMGRTHHPMSHSYEDKEGCRVTLGFPIPATAIVSVRITAEPYQWVEFADLPLQPAPAAPSPLRPVPITAEQVREARRRHGGSGGPLEIVRMDAPFASAQVAKPVPGALVVAAGDAAGFFPVFGDDDSAVVTVFPPDHLRDQELYPLAYDATGKEYPAVGGGLSWSEKPEERCRVYRFPGLHWDELRRVSIRVRPWE